MIKVNNRRTIFFLAKRNYLGNKRRNLIIILAVALTAFLITSVCSIGTVSYTHLDVYKRQELL